MKAQLENILPDANASLHAFRTEAERFSSGFHFHPEVELTLTLSGGGTRAIGDAVENIQPDQLCLIGSGLPHMYHSGEHEAGVPCVAEVLQFDPARYADVFALPETAKAGYLISAKAAHGLSFSPGAVESAKQLMPELRKCSGMRRFRLLIELLEVLAKDKGATTLCSPGFSASADITAATQRIEKVCAWIVENCHQPITHLDAARQASLTPAAFSRSFKKATHMTYSDYVNTVRLGQAGRMLVNSDANISEICYACGFTNLSNFNRRFKARYHVSPRQYRQMIAV